MPLKPKSSMLDFAGCHCAAQTETIEEIPAPSDDSSSEHEGELADFVRAVSRKSYESWTTYRREQGTHPLQPNRITHEYKAVEVQGFLDRLNRNKSSSFKRYIHRARQAHESSQAHATEGGKDRSLRRWILWGASMWKTAMQRQ